VSYIDTQYDGSNQDSALRPCVLAGFQVYSAHKVMVLLKININDELKERGITSGRFSEAPYFANSKYDPSIRQYYDYFTWWFVAAV
jgi:hypothetical protein